MNKVTEQDFRKPEFVGANPDDYERRKDGAIVRKDRWENFAHTVVGLVGMDNREFELPDVKTKVEEIVTDSFMLSWLLSYNGNIQQEQYRQNILKRLVDNSDQEVWLKKDIREVWDFK